MRLAWWSPWPPEPSGVAGRSAELVSQLASRGHAIDVFVDSARVTVATGTDEPPGPGQYRVLAAHDFVWRHARAHYDLPVYQVGNSHLHRFIWPYLFRFPGLAVLHDARVHHARAEALLSAGRAADYRAEFAWDHPEANPAAATFAVMGLEGIYYFQWPMVRAVVETARMVAAHSPGVARDLQQAYPHAAIEHVALGEGSADLDVARARREFRAAHALGQEVIVFGSFGGLTAEKRIPDILDEFRNTRAYVPGAQLLLVGSADPGLELGERVRTLGLTGSVHLLEGLSDAEFDRAIAACDVTLNLRWPTALETSGPWVRSLALGRPTVVLDLPHLGHVPALDPRSWQRQAPCEDLSPEADDAAVTVALDVRDLCHSLRLAMRRLGADEALRTRLGRAARAWWEREHTVARMVADYERLLPLAAARRPPRPAHDWPAHLAYDPLAHARSLLAGTAWESAAVASRLADLDS